MSIGDQLRIAREAREISLDKAAQETHIRLRYLEALEADQFDLLPSAAQVRGFIRAYGDYLKVNTSELIQELEMEWKVSQVTAPTVTTREVGRISTPNSDIIYKEVGQKLRSQRELMGLSLDDVERHTHIRMHYVQALEEGNISHLPSPVQGRGMLSNYASFLGLNTEEILLRFADGLQTSLYDRQALRNPGQTRSRQEEAGRSPIRPNPLRRLFSKDLFAGGLLIIFLLGFITWGALRISALLSNQEPSPTAPPVSELLFPTPGDIISATITIMPTSSTTITPTIGLVITPVAETTQEVSFETPIAFEPTPIPGSAPILLYVIANQQAWLRIIADGEMVFEGRTMPGSAYSFSGNELVELRTGNGGGLQVYFNQQDLGILGGFGEVVERVFTIHGILTATPRVQPTSTPRPTDTHTPSSTSTPTSTELTPVATPRP